MTNPKPDAAERIAIEHFRRQGWSEAEIRAYLDHRGPAEDRWLATAIRRALRQNGRTAFLDGMEAQWCWQYGQPKERYELCRKWGVKFTNACEVREKKAKRKEQR